MNLFNFGGQFGNPHVAPGYLGWAFIACLGVFQIIAAHYGYIGLAWVRPRWQPVGGWVLGMSLIVGGCILFFMGHTEGIFRPGPAGLELFILFGGGLVAALVVTLIGATLLQSHAALRPIPYDTGVIAERVDLPQGPGWLFRPTGRAGPCGAVCAVGTPGGGPEAVVPLATALAEAGLVVLAVGWSETDNRRPSEDDTLAAVLDAAAFLRERSNIVLARLGVAGVGLGGDIALQVAATNEGIRAVAAVGPWLDLKNAEPGLSLLHDMTLPQAWRWRHELHTTARRLDPLAHASLLDTRPVLLVKAENRGPSEQAHRSLAALCRKLTTLRVPRLGQEPDTTRQVALWLAQNL